MIPPIQNTSIPPCKKCHDRAPLELAFSMAFQPIVDVRTNTMFAYEALVRGLGKSCKTLRNVWYMSACNGILTGHEAKQP